jgi:hypothetical protein
MAGVQGRTGLQEKKKKKAAWSAKNCDSLRDKKLAGVEIVAPPIGDFFPV